MLTDQQEHEIVERLDAICVKARERMLQCDPFISRGGAEIDYMTREELAETHELKMALPTFGEMREAARERILARVAARKTAREKV